MKTVSIGDTHGMAVVDTVLRIIDEHDRFVFSGDYVDSFNVDDLTMKKNLLDVIKLKERYPEKIVLLWGNHDMHYLLGNEYYCTGFRPMMQLDFHEIFKSNSDLFQLSWQTDDYLWTHAGVSSQWFDLRFKPFTVKHKNISSFSALLNLAFDEKFPAIFDVGYVRGGDHEVGGPLWCDNTELVSDPLKGFNQIVGHNRVREIHTISRNGKEIIFIDLLESKETVDSSCFYYKEF